jgi:hypothetical protein
MLCVKLGAELGIVVRGESVGLFDLFSRKASKPLFPLTDACIRISQEDITKLAINGNPENEFKRGQILAMLIMMAAGHFTQKSLKWDKARNLKSSSEYLHRTNMDLITAEAIIWITFVIGQLWKSDQKEDREMFLRIGFTTVTIANDLCLSIIQNQTGYDFKEDAIRSRKRYMQPRNDSISEEFVFTIINSINRTSFRQSAIIAIENDIFLNIIIKISVDTFFITMPTAYYESFKRMLRHWPDKFPLDEPD